MRKVLYYIYKDEVYPITLTTNDVVIKLEIINPNCESVSSLSNGKSYASSSIMYSIIYSKTGKCRFSFGNDFIYNKVVSGMTSEQKTDLLLKLVVPRIEYKDGSKLVEENTLQKPKGIERTRGLVYKTVESQYLVKQNNYMYGGYKLKTLDFFEETKELKLSTKDYKCIQTYEQLESYVNSTDWSKIKYTGLDTETTGLNFFYDIDNPDEIVGMSHSYKDYQGVYIVFKYAGNSYLNVQDVYEIMKPTLVSKQVWQNGYFDDRVFKTYGIQQQFDYELMDVFQLTNPSHASKALKDNARLLLDEDTIELDEILGANFDPKLVEYIPLDLMTVYACSDTDYTLRIFKKLYERLDEQNKELLEKDMDNFHVITKANWFGFPSDKDYLQQLLGETLEDKTLLEAFMLKYIYKEYSIKLAKSLLEANGASKDFITNEVLDRVLKNPEFVEMVDRGVVGTRKPVLELNYAQDKKKILYSLLNYPKLRMTSSGKGLSTGSEYFADLMKYVLDEPREIINDNLYSKSKQTGEKKEILLDKNKINTYVYPLAYMFVQYAVIINKLKIYKNIASTYQNGRSHLTYSVASTFTGRITNGIQTIAGYAKGVIGHKQDSNLGLVVFDFDQIELRYAHNEAIALWKNMREIPSVKGDLTNIINTYDFEPLIDIFNDYESDVHTEMASRFTKQPIEKISTYVRKKYKETTFAGLYGGSEVIMARKELAQAKTKKEREEIIKTYTQTKISWMSTDLHLLNYFEISKKLPLEVIDTTLIPFNLNSKAVGMSKARSGRKRFYSLDDLDSKKMRSISNQGRNQPIQGGCFDVYFQAITNLERALRESGLTDAEVRSIIFVHDEDGVEYLKSSVNPLWLCAMIFKYCCIEIPGHPIKYYCTPAVVCNWAQGKSDKYEIPKNLLAELSTNIDDYPILDTYKHDEYILDVINNYYCREIDSYLRTFLDDTNCVDLNQLNYSKRFKFFKNGKMYRKGRTNVHKDENVNTTLNLLHQIRDRVDYSVKVDGNLIDLNSVVEVMSETETLDWDNDLFDEFDLENFIEDTERVDNLLSLSDMVYSVVNSRTLEELNSANTNVDNIIDEYVPRNIICEEFTDRIIFLLNENSDGILGPEAFDRVDNLLKELISGVGRNVYYAIQNEVIEMNFKIPMNFKVEKFDKFISTLRT